MPHLVVSISGHGFGHVAQTAPILNQLHRLLPSLRLTVRSSVPLAHLRSRIHVPFDHLSSEGDLGMVMSSAIDVCVAESRAAYRRFHADWEARVEGEAGLLRELGADMVFSNVGYLPLAGAQHAGIANAALCSLNWFDIYHHYCGEDEISAQMLGCYTRADAFLRATPGMPMKSLPNLVPVAPIADFGANRRDELNRHLRLSKEERLVLVSLGGIASRLPMEHWPRIDGVRWLVQNSWQVQHPDAIVLESLPLHFGDLLASCDALLCKPGYGSFVEAACSAVPVLYVSRADWPESPALTEWLQRHGECREVPREMLEEGRIAGALHALWQTPRRARVIPCGADEVATWLLRHLPHSGGHVHPT
ncbi:MAG: hypothetical protein Q8O64_19375 [Sideroxyarcus sp.]|nr:hypothetical protein [Sideroxyarcus sp.]